MPAPKDPIKREQWRANLRSVALAKGFGKWMTGRILSEITKQKVKAAGKARATPEYRLQLSQRAIKNGNGRWMQGRSLPHISAANKRRTGKTYEELYGERAQEEVAKRKHGNRIRHVGKRKADTRSKHGDTFEYTEWRNAVFKRDNFICQHCFWKKYLHAHHIKPWAQFPELRFEVSNGIALCVLCHKAEHAAKKGIT